MGKIDPLGGTLYATYPAAIMVKLNGFVLTLHMVVFLESTGRICTHFVPLLSFALIKIAERRARCYSLYGRNSTTIFEGSRS